MSQETDDEEGYRMGQDTWKDPEWDRIYGIVGAYIISVFLGGALVAFLVGEPRASVVSVASIVLAAAGSFLIGGILVMRKLRRDKARSASA